MILSHEGDPSEVRPARIARDAITSVIFDTVESTQVGSRISVVVAPADAGGMDQEGSLNPAS
jgi:hypothetical protein